MLSRCFSQERNRAIRPVSGQTRNSPTVPSISFDAWPIIHYAPCKSMPDHSEIRLMSTISKKEVNDGMIIHA